MSVGYSGTPLPKKLGIRSGFKVLLVNDPKHFLDLLVPFPDDAKFCRSSKTPVEYIHLFVTKESDLKKQLAKLKPLLKKDGMLWVSWPKKTSKLSTDIDGNIVRETGLKTGLVDTKVCAVDEDWSGLKFMYRVKDR